MKLPIVELGLKRPLPIEVTAVTLPFWEGLKAGQFFIARCQGCSRFNFPPRAVCPDCHSRKFDWCSACGRGVLYASTKVHSSPSLYGILSPMRVAIVDLEEGIRVVTRLLPSRKTQMLDSPVELVITRHPDGYHYAARAVESTS